MEDEGETTEALLLLPEPGSCGQQASVFVCFSYGDWVFVVSGKVGSGLEERETQARTSKEEAVSGRGGLARLIVATTDYRLSWRLNQLRRLSPGSVQQRLSNFAMRLIFVS